MTESEAGKNSKKIEDPLAPEKQGLDLIESEKWIVIGGGPGAWGFRCIVEPDRRDGYGVITTNSGLKICQDPDLYWISDGNAVKNMKKLYTRYAEDGGNIVAGVGTGLPGEITPFDKVNYSEKGRSWYCRSSGFICLRLACERLGGEKIKMIGFDGFNRIEKKKKPARRGLNDAVINGLHQLFGTYTKKDFIWYSSENFLDQHIFDREYDNVTLITGRGE